MTDLPPETGAPLPQAPGARLRAAREAQGLSLAEIAARTRVPLRQLEAIEVGDYSALPSVTYSVGFAKAYARAVGEDEVSIAHDVRALGAAEPVRRTEYISYDDEQESKVPKAGVVIVGVVLAVILLIGVGLWYGTDLFRGGETPASVPEAAPTAASSPVVTQTVAPAPTAGQVVLAAGDTEVWLRVYDADNKTLYMGTMKPGEKFDVPADANNPMINIGRPDELIVTVNGSAVPALGSGRVAIKNVPVSAAALLARGTAAAAPTPAANAAPSARATRSSTRVPPFFAPSSPGASATAAPAEAAPAPASTPAP